jgi:hypothetical protein
VGSALRYIIFTSSSQSFNFFAPLRTTDMDTETTGAENALPELEVSRKPSRLPQIFTSTTNVIRLQSDLKDHVKGEYEFRNTRHGTSIITNEVADYLAMKSYLGKIILLYYLLTIFRKAYEGRSPSHSSRHASGRCFQQSLELMKMTATRTAPNGQTHVETLPLSLVTLTRNVISQEIFKLNSLNHVIVKVELIRAQTGLTQCYNCQNFGHVWANCKEPPQCLWCGGGHLHEECPEKDKYRIYAELLHCTLVGDKPHLASYQGCSH